MRRFVKSTGQWLRAACFWPLVLLALPNCMLDFDSVGPQPGAFDPGPSPASNAIMCEIPMRDAEDDECATQQDVDEGISFSAAATALVEGRNNPVALDFRPDALAACNGMPRRKQFNGTYPDGLTVCLNCGTQIPAVYGDPTKASREELIAFRQNVIALRSELMVSQQLAEALLKQYKAAAAR